MRHLFSLAILALLAIASAPNRSAAQNPNEFEEFRRREAERLRGFLSKDDADFSDFLKKDWKDFALMVAPKPLTRPKPTAVPVAPPAPAPNVTPAGAPVPVAPVPTPVAPVIPAPIPTPVPAPVSTPPEDAEPAPRALPGGAIPTGSNVSSNPRGRGPRGPAPVPAGSSANMLSAMFFGALVQVPKVELALKPLPAEVTSESIAQFWEQISAAQTKDILAALHRQRDLMSLGDWAFAQMAYNTALPLAKGDATLARLIAWHFLVKSGYAARVGFSGDRVHVLLKASELVYGVSFFTFGSDRFYVLDLSGGLPPTVGSIRTYDKDHPDAKKSIAFQMAMLPILADDPQSRTLRFAYNNRKFEFPVTVNRNLVRFLNNYPQTQLPGYLNPEIDSPAMDELVSALRPIIAGRSEVESVEVILRFVQTAFDYKTDPEQFQREKWLFPEETLFYPFSDCEDRSILFAYLTRRLVPSVSVVGLIYSNHIATAIKFNSAVQGDVRMHRGERYVVSDPTYINASVGMEMPQYKDASPTIVEARALQRR